MESDLIIAEALKLSPYERAQIAEALMQSLEDDAQSGRNAKWAAWVDEQAKLALNGKLPVQNGPELLAGFRGKIQ